MVYARSSSAKRMYLWDKLRTLSHMIDGPWIIGGDFNSIMDAHEKSGGVPVSLSKGIDFINCMDDCGMIDSGFIGKIHTWCNR